MKEDYLDGKAHQTDKDTLMVGEVSEAGRNQQSRWMDEIISERDIPKDITEPTTITMREEIDGETEANALNTRNSERSEYMKRILVGQQEISMILWWMIIIIIIIMIDIKVDLVGNLIT
jgi:hypothetical protein